MRRIAVLLLFGWGLLVPWLACAPHHVPSADPSAREAPAADSDSIRRLRESAAEFPDDPDLAWALVRQLLIEEHPEAEAELRAYLERWPTHQPEAGIQLGRLLFASERLEEALAAIDAALEIDSEQAAGYVYRALALHRLGYDFEAHEALDEAARISPELGEEIARLRTSIGPAPLRPQNLASTELESIEAGETLVTSPDLERGERGAERPSFSAAREPTSEPFRLFAAVGGQWDSNPDRAGRQGGRDPADPDFDGIWELGLSYQDPGADEDERAAWIPRLGAGYSFEGAQHIDTHDRNYQRQQGFVSARWNLGSVTARSLALAAYDRRSGSSYRWFGFGRMGLAYSASPKWGTSEIYGDAEYTDYSDGPSLSSLDLDGWELGGGIRHRARVPGTRKVRATLGVHYARLETDASRDALGFASPYDNRSLEGRMQVELILPWQLRADLSGVVGHAWYPHRNVVDFRLGGSGKKREDEWYSWYAALRRPLTRILDLELSYRGIDSNSNVPFYDYTSHTVGIEFGVVWDFTPWEDAD